MNRKSPTRNTTPIPAPTIPPTVAPTLELSLFATEGGLEARAEEGTGAAILEPLETGGDLEARAEGDTEGDTERENKSDVDVLADGAEQSSML